MKFSYLLPMVLVAVGGFPTHLGAQEPNLDRAYHPNKPVHVVITFAGRVDVSSAGVQFNLYKLDDQAQRLWTRVFNLTELKPLPPNSYEATGTVPLYAASGWYRLTRAWSGIADLAKNYDYPDTLHQDITIRVINEKPDPLPTIIDLKLVKWPLPRTAGGTAF